MNVQDRLARLRFEDPATAEVVVDALWTKLAREEPRMFAALWRRAHRPSRRPAAVERSLPIPIQWVEERAPAVRTPAATNEPPLSVPAQPVPAVNLAPPPVAAPSAPPHPVMIEPSPSLADLLPLEERVAHLAGRGLGAAHQPALHFVRMDTPPAQTEQQQMDQQQVEQPQPTS